MSLVTVRTNNHTIHVDSTDNELISIISNFNLPNIFDTMYNIEIILLNNIVCCKLTYWTDKTIINFLHFYCNNYFIIHLLFIKIQQDTVKGQMRIWNMRRIAKHLWGKFSSVFCWNEGKFFLQNVFKSVSKNRFSCEFCPKVLYFGVPQRAQVVVN